MKDLFESKYRERSFKRLVNNKTITAESLLIALEYVSTKMQSKSCFDESENTPDERRPFFDCLINLYRDITGVFPTINDIRFISKKLDHAMSLWDNTDKKVI